MKKQIVILSLICLLASCVSAPTIDEVETQTREGVEELLTEDNNENLSFRLERYFLTEQTDDLTYVGTLKATAFYKDKRWNDRTLRIQEVLDSTRLYRSVEIKFRDKKYQHYTISIKGDD